MTETTSRNGNVAHAAVDDELTEVEVSRITKTLRATFDSGRTRSAEWRSDQLNRLAQMMTDSETEIIDALSADLGRAPFESWLTDVAGTIAEARYAAKHVKRWMRRDRRMLELPQLPGRGWIEYEPYGTVLIIGTWNLPFLLTLGPAISALAAGNTVLIKPSEFAPRTSRLLAELVPRYLDHDAVAVAEGGRSTSERLLTHEFDRILFTGGAATGRKILAAAARHLTPVTLELGGKSPVILADDCDVDVAASRVAWTKLINSGQVCVAPDYVLAHRDVAERFVDRLCDAWVRQRADQPKGMRVLNIDQLERLGEYLIETRGEIAFGGGLDPSSLTVEPTVILNPDPSEPLMTEEIFGPILPILTVDSLDDAINFVNARPKPLAAYLFSRSRAVRNRVVSEVSAGGMLINHVAFQASTTRLPFGGVGNSGMGAYHGRWGFQEFSHAKTVLTKPTRPDLSKMLYPPYTDRAWKLARKLF
ncbi:aldehyde dehydrogenase family protein [Mycolicibacterium boenickei]|uniref:Aldehyde dehydrogenase n=1 Tax=Mycolicibacterium boenickei TaxID=146017 RepID=A0AAX3A1M8_9MYCO|nr:aldehyde dehydrogenase family protein [Mycolicibacterium boenickei]PEG58426.1 aldehyde dehydrogenase family protein [Mycolicibacterium boenickei]UNC01234.1 aldehyde dehydrogenase family protein [Mycolicibacterium boenickei]BBX91094.1 aldehyde dehydrogenase [Mycolicibacterium boenickei]